MKKLSILIANFFLMVSLAQGQKVEKKVFQNEIRIRPFLIENQVVSINNFESRAVPGRDHFEGRFFRLVRFSKVLNRKQKSQLQQAGFTLEGYIPYQSYLISFPKRISKSVLSQLGASHIISLSLENKLSKPLAEGLANHQWGNKEEMDLLVDCYSSVSKQGEEIKLKELGQVNSYGTHARTFFVKTKFENLATIASLPFVKYIEIEPGVPVPDDTRGRSLHRSNTINTDYLGGLKYDGKGVSIGLADDGHVGPHIDFQGRMTSFTTGNSGNHGDMTSGICVGAANLDPRYKGMATGAHLYVYDISNYPHVNNAVQNLANLKTVITSTSYSQGCNQYTTASADGDDKLFNNKPLMFVFSGGNNATANCGYGAGAGWGNITGGYKNGKNVIATGNVDANGLIDPTSSRGPAPDGRIKPDICANGRNQMSTDGNNTYQVGGGTSAACPGLAGVLAQLYQAWREIKQEENPEAALLKGILLNTADDLGNPGPDFTYGWGQVNARKALNTIIENRYKVDSLEQGDSINFPIQVTAGTQNLKVMIYWSDPSGTPNSLLNLVNNLDLKVEKPNGSMALPWKLKTAPVASQLNSFAGNGVDSLNNVEQVSIDAPEEGQYVVRVNGKSIPEGPQRFYIIYKMEDNGITVTYPFGGECLVPGQQELIRWDAEGYSTGFNVSYSADSGQTWTSISNPAGTARQATWTVPSNLVTGKGLIRVSRGGFSDVNDVPFSSIPTPGNIQVVKACADSITISWNAVTGAAAYEVSFLGEKYMDSVATTTSTQAKIPYNFNQVLWYSVRAILPNGLKGSRSIAKQKLSGLVNCQLITDAQLAKTLSPVAGMAFSCSSFANFPVKIRIKNKGIGPLSNIPVSYKLNNTPAVQEIAPITLAPGDSIDYQFSTGINLNPNTTNKIVLVTAMPQDFNLLNDSSIINFSTSALPANPVSQGFQSGTFPPPTWSITNFGFGTWTRSGSVLGANGAFTNTARMDNFSSNQSGSKDYLTSPPIDLTTAGPTILTFDRAYAPRLNRRDSLMIWVSTDCGLSFFPSGYAKDHVQLSTSPSQTTSFTPGNENQWKKDTLDLTNYMGGTVIVRFVSVSRFGNVLYIDNIKTEGVMVGINENIRQNLSVFPNPAETNLTFRMPENNAGPTRLFIYSSEGKMVSDRSLEYAPQQEINIENLSTGMYQLLLWQNGKFWQSRFVKK